MWVAVALFATGCATLSSPSDVDDAQGPAEVPREERAPRGSLSCGGRAVPEGWPDYSAWWDEELLAPFFQCTSPGEFLALQRRVDMPRLVEALEDWSAVRLGALGPMEARAARVLQRKRLSFLVTAIRKYGAYAQVLILFLVDTAFDDEVRELLLLLARDKQLEQTLGQMEAVREALERRGFKLSDYPDRDEQLGDVVRGLSRAAADVASTIPAVEGARGGGVFAVRAHLPPPYQEAFDETERALTREHWAPGHVVLGAFDSLTFGVPLGFYYLAEGTGHGGASLYQGRYEQAARELAPAALLVGLYAGGKGGRSLSEARGAAGIGERGGRLQVPEPGLPVWKEVAERLRERLGEDGLGQLARLVQGRREVAVMVATGGEPVAVAIYEARGDLARAQAVLSQARPELRGSTQPMAGAGKGHGGAASAVDEAASTTPKRAGARSTLGGEAIADWRVRRVLEQIREKAAAGTFRRAGNYHAHFSEARVLEILRNPDAIYESSGRAGKLIYHQGGDIVVVEGPGSGQGQVITGYGPSGIRAESGARALGGSPMDLGTPVTPEMITGGTIPVPPNRPRIPAATQVWPPSAGDSP
ncbi:HNH endonuclease [Cystobacter fuscus]|uniref:HNH endonuclease n=1 Tax=Cystobacter fuscus TaxID=43 RepID=UPI002B3132C5|nr:HNH endonuclease [Cystobacter fuscus]